MSERKTKDQMFAALRQAGYRITKQRIDIIDFIAGKEDHPSAQKIYGEIKYNSGLSFATIYNTLKTLVELEVIKEIDFEHVENRYDTNLIPHLNLVCTKCGKIEDVDFEVPVSSDEIHKNNNFKVTNYRLEYIGLCGACK